MATTNDLDDIDSRILRERVERREQHLGPRVGDWAIMPDGEYRRFTHDHGEPWGLQTTWMKGSQSFYLSNGGQMDYSGGLAPAIPLERITPTGETKEAQAWFFHHDRMKAHNGVDVMVPCRVYRITPTVGDQT